MCLVINTAFIPKYEVADRDIQVFKIVLVRWPTLKSPFTMADIPEDGKLRNPVGVSDYNRPEGVLGTVQRPILETSGYYRGFWTVSVGFHAYTDMSEAEAERWGMHNRHELRVLDAVIPAGTKYIMNSGEVVAEVMDLKMPARPKTKTNEEP